MSLFLVTIIYYLHSERQMGAFHTPVCCMYVHKRVVAYCFWYRLQIVDRGLGFFTLHHQKIQLHCVVIITYNLQIYNYSLTGLNSENKNKKTIQETERERCGCGYIDVLQCPKPRDSRFETRVKSSPNLRFGFQKISNVYFGLNFGWNGISLYVHRQITIQYPTERDIPTTNTNNHPSNSLLLTFDSIAYFISNTL